MNEIGGIDPRGPVLVGIGLVSQREEDPRKAREPVELMIEAVRQAGNDCGSPKVLEGVGRICVPHGRWSYGDPGRTIAQAIGAKATTVISRVGVLQQTLIGDACRRIAEGEEDAVLIVGGEAGFRILRSSILGIPVDETPDDRTPDEVIVPHAALRAPAELAVGLTMPVGLYAMVESAIRAARGEGVEAHRDRIAELYAGFSLIAAANPHAWTRKAFTPAEIRDAGPHNAMQAFPYTKRQCSSWSVDQASALLIVSSARALQAGIARDKWVFALASSESNHMLTVSSRPQLQRSPGARIAGKAALEGSNLAIEDIQFLDLYSCFPSAVQICAEELGVPAGRVLTVTGGMAFAGGPYNNYVLHSTGQIAQLIRGSPGSKGLVGCISGVITKQAFGIWSQTPGSGPFAFSDVTETVAHEVQPLKVVNSHSGTATIVGHTVLYTRGAAPRGIVIADVRRGCRAVAFTEDERLLGMMVRRELCRESVQIDGNVIAAVNWADNRHPSQPD